MICGTRFGVESHRAKKFCYFSTAALISPSERAPPQKLDVEAVKQLTKSRPSPTDFFCCPEFIEPILCFRHHRSTHPNPQLPACLPAPAPVCVARAAAERPPHDRNEERPPHDRNEAAMQRRRSLIVVHAATRPGRSVNSGDQNAGNSPRAGMHALATVAIGDFPASGGGTEQAHTRDCL